MSEAGATLAITDSIKARIAAIRCLWRVESVGARLPFLYCVLDAARDPAIYPKVKELASQTRTASLYQGPTADELAAVAPYLVRMGAEDWIFDWIWENGWGRSWGIFLWSHATLEELRAHLRKFTKVQTEDGRTLLFRFYDPRVIRLTLPVLTPAQLKEFYGDALIGISTESADGVGIDNFSFTAGALRASRLDLASE